MKKCVYPGSFDPITMGHLDIIKRAARCCDELYVAVLVNNNKKAMFSQEKRIEMIKKAVESELKEKNIKVEAFDGLLADYMKERDIKVIVKGIRAVSDYEYEWQMAMLNKFLDKSIETFFMLANPKYSYLSSSGIKEILKYSKNIDGLVPECIKYDIINNNN